jgi:hypothetical protein
MGNGLLAFAAGLGSGYLSGQQRQKDQLALEEERAMRKQTFQNQQDEVDRLKRDRASLADAGKLATVNPEGATLGLADGTQTVYDNSGVANSDFRQLRAADQATGNQTLARAPLVVPPSLADGQIPKTAQVATPMASLADNQIASGDPHAVDGEQATTPEPSLANVMPGSTMPQAPQSSAVLNGKAYPSLAAAKVAEAAYNTPEAADQRIKQAIVLQGKPLEAKQYQAAVSTEKANEMALADSAWRRKLGQAMMTPGTTALSGLSKLFTQSEFGPMAGKQVQDVPSADGKTVNISIVNPDGSLTPSAFNFTNDQDGVTRAAYMLDNSITPEHRFTSYVADRKAAAQTAFQGRQQNEVERHNLEDEAIKKAAAVAAEKKARMEFDPLGLNSPPPGTGSNGANGPDMLKAIPVPLANQVKALAEGRLAFPSGFALKTPYWQSMLTLVGQYDPSFDAINYQKRSQTANAFSKGVQGNAVRAVNQTLMHMGTLDSAINALDNVSSLGVLNRPVNSAINYAQEKGNSPTQGNFKQTVQAVASELRKVFSSGGVGNLQELKQWEDTMPLNASKDQQQAYLKNATKLLQGAMVALDNQYKTGLGPKASINDKLITPEARAVLDRLTGAGPTPSSDTQTGVQPQGSRGPGQKPNAPVAMPKDKGALQTGVTYQTTRGPAVWNGTAFEGQ